MFSVENELFFTNACSSFIMDLIFAVITIAFTDEICLNFTTLDYSFIKENTFCLDKHASNDIISSYIVNNLINNDIIKIR
jgi:hypothetical protein